MCLCLVPNSFPFHLRRTYIYSHRFRIEHISFPLVQSNLCAHFRKDQLYKLRKVSIGWIVCVLVMVVVVVRHIPRWFVPSLLFNVQPFLDFSFVFDTNDNIIRSTLDSYRTRWWNRSPVYCFGSNSMVSWLCAASLHEHVVAMFLYMMITFRSQSSADLKKNPVEGFSAGLADDSDIYHWEVLIIGPPDTL